MASHQWLQDVNSTTVTAKQMHVLADIHIIRICIKSTIAGRSLPADIYTHVNAGQYYHWSMRGAGIYTTILGLLPSQSIESCSNSVPADIYNHQDQHTSQVYYLSQSPERCSNSSVPADIGYLHWSESTNRSIPLSVSNPQILHQ